MIKQRKSTSISSTNKEKGIALYMVIVLLSVFMAVVLTLTSVSLSQIRVSWQAGDSSRAFGAADSGVEQALYNIRKLGSFEDITTPVVLSNGSSYTVDITMVGEGATIQSKGIFKNTRRSIEAKY
ncbi:MAG: pilus assembly PilX N-terminal domain-containing protein [Candidatus Pacebacteria bacterium]|nr:pilus assembly PilX N-terminal domain-containing protein [Candidatus Paceibacterota bacterium]